MLFQLLARQANSASEANTDKRFFNVQYRKNLDNLCAPLHKNCKKVCQINFKGLKTRGCHLTSLLMSASFHFLCNFGNFISAFLRCDSPASFKRGLFPLLPPSLNYDPQQRTSQQNFGRVFIEFSVC